MSARTPARTPRKRRTKQRQRIESKEDLKREQSRMRQARRRHRMKLDNEHLENELARQRNKIRRLEAENKKLESEVVSLSEACDSAQSRAAASASRDDSDVSAALPRRVKARATLEKIVINDDDDAFESPESNESDVTRLQDEYKRASQRRRVFRFLTGLKHDEFVEYFLLVQPSIASITFEGRNRQRLAVSKLSEKLQLFVTLIWFRRYWPLWLLAFNFDLPERYVAKIVYRVSIALDRYHRSLSIEQGGFNGDLTENDMKLIRESQKSMQVPGATIDFALDGCHLVVGNVTFRKSDSPDVCRAKMQRMKHTHNEKHSCSAVNVLALVTLDGRFVLVDGPRALQEGKHLQMLDLYKKLKQINAVVCADAGLHVVSAPMLADKDFVHGLLMYSVGPTSIKLCTHVTRHPNLFSEETVAFCGKVLMSSRLISKLRIVVENLFALVKKFKSVVYLLFIFTYSIIGLCLIGGEAS